MMDAQKQERLNEIEKRNVIFQSDDRQFLLQIIREQEVQLTKYKCVVEAAREISNISLEYEAGRYTLYQVYEPEMKSLRDALDSLKA